MKEISSAATVEVTFVAYDIYKQEGGNIFSNSGEMLVVQLLVLMTSHVLAKSRGSQMTARIVHTHTHLIKAFLKVAVSRIMWYAT